MNVKQAAHGNSNQTLLLLPEEGVKSVSEFGPFESYAAAPQTNLGIPLVAQKPELNLRSFRAIVLLEQLICN
jgi:hypothetical protein